MLVTLGMRNDAEDLVDLLAACHGRIRQHLVLARRLVQYGSTCTLKEVGETAFQIRRYFGLALPLHVADEEQTIAPQLVGRGGEVALALEQVAREHERDAALVDQLVELCAEIESDPAQFLVLEERLSRIVDELATLLGAHLELEERILFPALRALPPRQRAAMLTAVRQRRDQAGAMRA